MPLSLTFRPGEAFYVAGERFVVTEVSNPIAFSVRRDRDGKMFYFTYGDRHEIKPSVFVSVGLRERGRMGRVAFDAPREIKITREPHEH